MGRKGITQNEVLVIALGIGAIIGILWSIAKKQDKQPLGQGVQPRGPPGTTPYGVDKIY